MKEIVKEILIITFFMYLLFPLIHTLFVSIIVQIRFIFDRQLRNRSDELEMNISFYFIISIISNLFWFLVYFFLLALLFYRSIADFSEQSRFYYLVVASVIFIFDIIYFSKVDQKYIIKYKYYFLYVVTLTGIEFSDKKTKIIYSPMETIWYWIVLIISIVGIIIKYKIA
jgi:hypothetical protein